MIIKPMPPDLRDLPECFTYVRAGLNRWLIKARCMHCGWIDQAEVDGEDDDGLFTRLGDLPTVIASYTGVHVCVVCKLLRGSK